MSGPNPERFRYARANIFLRKNRELRAELHRVKARLARVLKLAQAPGDGRRLWPGARWRKCGRVWSRKLAP